MLNYKEAAVSIWFEIWGGRGSGSKSVDFPGKNFWMTFFFSHLLLIFVYPDKIELPIAVYS